MPAWQRIDKARTAALRCELEAAVAAYLQISWPAEHLCPMHLMLVRKQPACPGEGGERWPLSVRLSRSIDRDQVIDACAAETPRPTVYSGSGGRMNDHYRARSVQELQTPAACGVSDPPPDGGQ